MRNPPTLATGHVVRTADGVTCRVQYIHADRTAELTPLGAPDEERLVLPIAELKRIPNPRDKRPPIEGMPEPRPLCAWCRRKLRPVVNCEWNGSKAIGAALAYQARVTRRTWTRWDSYEEVFCTTRCAIKFAGASYRGGFRRKP